MTPDADCKYPTLPITFPDLRKMFEVVVGRLARGEVGGSVSDYVQRINMFGGIERVVNHAINAIEPEIFMLEGKLLTPTLLRTVQQQQVQRQPQWPDIAGYVDFVTDDREGLEDYLRYYVGQSGNSPRRLVDNHIAAIRRASLDSFHYFVLCRGLGHRYANFLRLWSFPKDRWQTTSDNVLQVKTLKVTGELVQNVLKLIFCRAFASLPSRVLTEFTGPTLDGEEWLNVGLNVMSPLYQGRSLSPATQREFIELLRESPDPDHVAWANFSRTRRRYKNLSKPRILFPGDYRREIELLAQKAGFDLASISDLRLPAPFSPFSIESELRSLDKEAHCKANDENLEPFAMPVGNRRAKIGVILDSDTTGLEGVGSSLGFNSIWALGGMKLTPENSLVWTSSFEQHGSGPSRFPPDFRNRALKLNRSVVLGSAIRTIVLSGVQVQHDIISVFGEELSGPHKLILRDHPFRIWFLRSDEQLSKIFISSPEPVIHSCLKDAQYARQITDVFGLVGAVTGTTGLISGIYADMNFYAALKIRRNEELAGECAEMTTETIDLQSREWLLRRGFVDDANVRQLEQIAGSLTQGIAQLVTHLSHKARKFNTNGPYGGWYDDEAYQELKALWDSVHGAHLTRIKEAREFSLSGAKEDNPIVDDLLVSGSHQPGILEDPTIQFLIDTSEGLMKKKAEEPHGDEQESDGESEDEAEEKEKFASHSSDTKTQSWSANNLKPFDTALEGQSSQEAGISKKEPEDLESLLISKYKTHAVNVTADRRAAWLPIGGVFKFRVELDVDIPPNAIFLLRADLSKSGTSHPNRILGDFEGYEPNDPALRLAVQYRLEDGGAGTEWKWAKRKPTEKAIRHANTIVDRLEGKPMEVIRKTKRRFYKTMNNLDGPVYVYT
ncbi:hypothetical protein DL769_002000 [Monosporascus sp. CRB-8-3]|nr:hypothetical protein DL769_002000 [Monosporascus sp. CRB-8-3]